MDRTAVRWPNGARVAVNIVLNVEEGAERGPRYGDPDREPTSEAIYELTQQDRDLIQESAYDFGANIGGWRVIQLMQEFGVPLTIFGSGRAIEAQPEFAAACHQAGYDFVGHGYRWEPHEPLTPEQERTAIQKTKAAIKNVTGEGPRGWFTRPLPSMVTRKILIEEGFEYDSDSLADELPYRVDVDGHSHLVVPYTLDVNDTRFWKNSFFTGDQWLSYCRDAFDYHVQDTNGHGVMLSIGLHSRIIGRPARALALKRLLEHISSHSKDVWLCRRNDIVDYWTSEIEGR